MRPATTARAAATTPSTSPPPPRSRTAALRRPRATPRHAGRAPARAPHPSPRSRAVPAAPASPRSPQQHAVAAAPDLHEARHRQLAAEAGHVRGHPDVLGLRLVALADERHDEPAAQQVARPHEEVVVAALPERRAGSSEE